MTPRGGAAAVAPAATITEEKEKKAIDPRIFLVGGLFVVAVIIGGFTSGVFSGGGGSGDLPTIEQGNSVAPVDPSAGEGSGSRGISQPPASTGGGPTMPTGPTDTTAVPATYKVVVPPNPKYATGTMAIFPATPNITAATAGGLAKFAKDQWAPNGKWSRMQIVVFSNQNAADAFKKYQIDHQLAPLTSADFQNLAASGVWSGAVAYYESQGNASHVYQPSASPQNWWAGRGS